MSNHASKIVN